MNRHEALEWAADFLERAKIWEGSSLTPAVRLEMLSNFADSVVQVAPPPVVTKYRDPDPECIAYIKLLASKVTGSKSIQDRNNLRKEMADHLDALAGDSVTHPGHTYVDPASISDDPVDPEPATKGSKRY